jgi:hypothetical protein
MRSLALKRKESRILWQVLMQGILVVDRKMKNVPAAEQEEYQKLREKLLLAWKSGLLVGGVRPKRKIYDIMPEPLLHAPQLADLQKEWRKAKAKAKREISVPHKKPTA